MIEGHGDDLYRYGDKVKYNFSSNIYGKFDHDGLKHFLADRVANVAFYPEPAPFSLERILASHLGVCRHNVVVTAGATDAIYRIADRFHQASSHIMSFPTFNEYHDACIVSRHGLCDDISTADIVWVCNPNNPTGEVISKKVIVDVINNNPKVVFVVDQSYSEYTKEPLLSAVEASAMENVILIGSFTKRFGVPGLRLGYMVGCDKLMCVMRQNTRPWTVSQMSIDAGKYLLENVDSYMLPLTLMLTEARRVGEELKKMGINAMPTSTPFFLCEVPIGSRSSRLKEFLIERYGVLIRDASNFEGLTDRHFRISVQSPDENNILINAIRQWNML